MDGRPDNSHNNEYLYWMYKDLTNKESLNNLKDTIEYAIDLINQNITKKILGNQNDE